MKSYFEKLKDPRWQRKRLEVLQDRSFECEECGDRESTLHVHHPAYRKNIEPWDYHTDELMCVCENCHKRCHYESDILTSILTEIRLDINQRSNVLFITGFLAAISQDGPFNIKVITDYEFISGIAFFYKQTPETVFLCLENNELSHETISKWSRSGTIITDFTSACAKQRRGED